VLTFGEALRVLFEARDRYGVRPNSRKYPLMYKNKKLINKTKRKNSEVGGAVVVLGLLSTTTTEGRSRTLQKIIPSAGPNSRAER
jgi:hypothetical protein